MGEKMLENHIVYMNGKFVAWQKATVHIMSSQLWPGIGHI